MSGSQRTGLITFTPVPHRSQIILAKAIAAIIVGVVSVVMAFGIGAVGNVIGSAINRPGRHLGRLASPSS